MKPCRKCGTPNPKSNQYCMKCGSVLSVPTSFIKAQERTLFPVVTGLRWRWVLLGIPVVFGFVSIALLSIGALLATMLSGSSIGSLTTIGVKAPGVMIIATLIFILAFALGGLALSRAAKRKIVAESTMASLIVLGLISVAGHALSTDALLAGSLFALPCALMGALGAWIGGEGARKK